MYLHSCSHTPSQVGYMESVRMGNKTKAKNILAVMDDILVQSHDSVYII